MVALAAILDISNSNAAPPSGWPGTQSSLYSLFNIFELLVIQQALEDIFTILGIEIPLSEVFAASCSPGGILGVGDYSDGYPE